MKLVDIDSSIIDICPHQLNYLKYHLSCHVCDVTIFLGLSQCPLAMISCRDVLGNISLAWFNWCLYMIHGGMPSKWWAACIKSVGTGTVVSLWSSSTTNLTYSSRVLTILLLSLANDSATEFKISNSSMQSCVALPMHSLMQWSFLLRKFEA